MVMVMSLHKETVPIFCQYFHGNAQIPAHAHGKIVLCIVPSKNQILSTPYHNNKLFCLFPSLIAFTFAEETTNMSPSLMYRQHIGPSNNISCASSTVLQKEFFLPQPMIILLAHIWTTWQTNTSCNVHIICKPHNFRCFGSSLAHRRRGTFNSLLTPRTTTIRMTVPSTCQITSSIVTTYSLPNIIHHFHIINTHSHEYRHYTWGKCIRRRWHVLIANALSFSALYRKNEHRLAFHINGRHP